MEKRSLTKVKIALSSCYTGITAGKMFVAARKPDDAWLLRCRRKPLRMAEDVLTMSSTRLKCFASNLNVVAYTMKT